MTPEAQARLIIDTKLLEAGWQVQDLRRVNLGAAVGVAVREYPTDTGPADYVLFVNREPVGVIEARPDSTILTFVEYQTECYARSALKWQVEAALLPFLFESTGQVIASPTAAIRFRARGKSSTASGPKHWRGW